MTERQNLQEQDNNKQQSMSKRKTEKPNSGSSTNLKSCLEGRKTTVFESILHTPSIRDCKLWFYESGDNHMVNSKKPQEPAHVNKKEIVSNFSAKTTTSDARHVSKQKGHITSGLYKHAHSQAVTQYLVHQKMKSKSIIEKNIPKSKDLRPSPIHSTPTVPISRPYSSNSKYQKSHPTNSSHSQHKQKRSPYEPERYRVQSNSKNRNYI